MIYIGADHQGFELKEHIKRYLERKGIKVEDVSRTFTPGDDYPAIAVKVARSVQKNITKHRGILICGSGAGVSIAANRFRGVRAVLAESTEAAILSRTDDNTNVLALGAQIVTPARAFRIVWTWLGTKFSGKPRHRRRLSQLARIPA
jgi:ribose 5-phosphate isomerase B